MGMKDFLKNNKSYNADGFDSEGYNRLGYDRMGYDRNGYDINGYDRDGYNTQGISKLTGRDKEGYDEFGFNSAGVNREGFSKDGFNAKGFDKDGFDRNGYDEEGYNRDGFNSEGIDRDGYNRNGYDKKGFDRNGYDKKGYDLEGYDRNGYDKKGFDKDGFDKKGFDKNGYDRDGYDKKGFNNNGFDRDGYDKKGFDKEGYDREGYNKKGFDIEGYNRDGFDKNGYDREGYDVDGFNFDGIDRNGFNVEGYDFEGYDREGYDRKGFNREGLSVFGFSREAFDDEGYHKITGYDAWGYNRYGYNVNGINKHTGRDRLGFDADGLDENGFNIWGFNIDTQKDLRGNSIESYDNNPDMTEEMCSKFETLYYEYMAGKTNAAINLANCYVYGWGTVRDYKKALRILLDVAIEYHDLDAIRELADHFYIGDIIGKNLSLSSYFMDIFDNKELESINQYKSRQALEFRRPINTKDRIFKEEQEHLERVISSLEAQIKSEEALIESLDDDTSWMDHDQLVAWRDQRERNKKAKENIKLYKQIKPRPYYARMDVSTSGVKESYYIGEFAYLDDWRDPASKVYSVWSEFGQQYRESSKTKFSIKGNKYDVILRRKLEISNGRLVNYYDEYVEGSEAANADITNTYLLRILEEKRGEKNITNIIRSIQLNQNDIIEADFKSNIIVQGCAGSGKTMILLHRLANMKYNQPNYDWSRVKIITPSNDFTFFIDELSRNLRINEIDKITLQEYYLQILEKYDHQYPERIGSDILNHFNIGNERKRIRDEADIEKDKLQVVYSEDFRKKLAELARNSKQDIQCFRDAMNVLGMNLKDILDKLNCKLPKRLPNYNFMLYIRTLFAYLCFGAVRNNENMLCIDEGQDICEMQYTLLYEVNGSRTCLNIYGDLAQRISRNVSISSWDKLKKKLNASYFELNENYRNSENIIKFYGKTLGINNGSFGLKTKDVEQFDKSDLDILLKMQLLLGNRTVVISNSENCVPPNVLSLCRSGKISENRISIMTVKQVKGLEFDTAFVFDEGMDKNEKYIAYTRALSELYISSEVPGCDNKALNIKNEDEEEKEFPEFRFDEKVEFYHSTILYEDDNIYLTLGVPEIQQDCFSVKMALRITGGDVSNLKITAEDFEMYNTEDESDQELSINSIPVYIPDGDDAFEQTVSFSIPVDRIPHSLLEDIESCSETFEYSFSLSISYEDSDGDEIEDFTDWFRIDVDGYFVDEDENEKDDNKDVDDDDGEDEDYDNDDEEDDEEDDDEDDEEDGDEDDDDDDEDEFTSITELRDRNDGDVLIVVRKGWRNDFCFVVEYFDGAMARGSQYLDGKFYKASAYNRYSKEFAIYDGPSVAMIEDQY